MCYNSDLSAIQLDLYSFVRSRVNNDSDAKDVVQNANQVLINKESQYDPDCSFRGWAFSIARWQILAFFKTVKRSILTFSPDTTEGEEANENWLSDVPFSTLIKKERSDSIKSLNNSLSDRERQVFNLLIEDLTIQEIADTIGSSKSNVYSLKSRSIERIRNFVLNNKNENYNKY
mgnify:CR=1 FL=1|tara:strand:- start:483 stop:1007 length:525 start_codon:yes stop_codon:yes gene_type:complete